MATLTRIKGENFLKLKAVEIEPDGSTVVIGGRNEQGKTAVLRIVRCLLGGKREHPATPLRDGADEGLIELDVADAFDLGDLHFERTVGPEGLGQLKITGRPGATLGGPQKLANRFRSTLMFDPMLFDRQARERPKEAADTLRAMLGIDTAADEKLERDLREERTEVGREVKRLRGYYESLPCHTDAPAAEQSAAELAAELERRREVNACNADKRRRLEGLRADARDWQRKIAEARAHLRTLEEGLDVTRAAGQELAAEVEQLVDEDLEGAAAAFDALEEANRKVRDNVARVEAVKAARDAEQSYHDLTDQITRVAARIAKTVTDADYPVDGMVVKREGVELDGYPWADASMSRRIRASVAIGFAQNPELRLLLIEAGAYLDEDNRRLIADLAEAAGGMALIEVVGKTDDCAVVIEDGEAQS